MTNRLSRRQLLLRGLQVSAGGAALAALSACGGGAGTGAPSSTGANVCYDPSKVDPSQESMRAALHYAEMSPDPAKICPRCTYSTFGSPQAMCGTCNIFSGGPINAHGHCDSWTQRAS